MSSDQIKRNIRWVLGCLIAFLVFLVLVQWFGFDQANRVDLPNVLAAPSRQALFGKDELGRDLFVRVFVGGAHTLLPSFWSSFLVASWGS